MKRLPETLIFKPKEEGQTSKEFFLKNKMLTEQWEDRLGAFDNEIEEIERELMRIVDDELYALDYHYDDYDDFYGCSDNELESIIDEIEGYWGCKIKIIPEILHAEFIEKMMEAPRSLRNLDDIKGDLRGRLPLNRVYKIIMNRKERLGRNIILGNFTLENYYFLL